LITTGTQTIGGTKTFSDATKNNGGIFLQNASSSSLAGYMNLGGLTNGVKFTSGGGISNSFTLPSATGYTFTFPNATGTLALTSDLTDFVTLSTAQTISGIKTFSSSILSSGIGFFSTIGGTNYGGIVGTPTYFQISAGGGSSILLKSDNGTNAIIINTLGKVDFGSTIGNGTYTYTLPSATGTIALVGGSGVGTVTSVAALTIGTSGTDLSSTVATSTTTPVITLNVPTASASNRGALSSADWTTFNNKQGTITLTTTGTSGAATLVGATLNIPNYGSALSGYLPLSGGTLTGALIGTQLSINTTNATGKINIQGPNDSGLLYLFNSSANARFMFNNYYGYGIDAMIIQEFNSSNVLQRSIISFQAGGNVLIGTTTDSGYKLDVNGTGRFSGELTATGGSPITALNTGSSDTNIVLKRTGGTTAEWDFYIPSGSTDLRFYNGGDRFKLTSAGAATFTNSVASAVGVSGSANTINQFILSNAGYRNSNTTISADTSTLSYYFLNYNDSSAVVYDRTLDIRVRGSADGTYGAGIIRFFANNYTSGSTETEIMNIKGTGVVKIISTTASSSGTTGALVVGGGVGVGGSVYASSFFETSDMRIKTLIQDNYQTKGIASITPKLYTKNGKVELGYYAQDFVGILDSAISKGSDDMLSLSYREVLVAKVYALEQRIKELENK
jgi:hypothetical protein